MSKEETQQEIIDLVSNMDINSIQDIKRTKEMIDAIPDHQELIDEILDDLIKEKNSDDSNGIIQVFNELTGQIEEIKND